MSKTKTESAPIDSDSKKTKTKGNIHIMLQGKGGCGKSLISLMLSLFIREKIGKVYPIDTDPLNHTLSDFKSVNAVALDILDGEEVNPRKFDAMVDHIIKTDDDVVIDNGANGYLNILGYLEQHDLIDIFRSFGREVFIHTVIAGGEAFLHTVNGFDRIAKRLVQYNVPIVVWLNPFLGDMKHKGQPFEDTVAYSEHKDRILAILELPTYLEKTHRHDFKSVMLENHKTFDDVMGDDTFPYMVRLRLDQVKRDHFNLLEQIPGII